MQPCNPSLAQAPCEWLQTSSPPSTPAKQSSSASPHGATTTRSSRKEDSPSSPTATTTLARVAWISRECCKTSAGRRRGPSCCCMRVLTTQQAWTPLKSSGAGFCRLSNNAASTAFLIQRIRFAVFSHMLLCLFFKTFVKVATGSLVLEGGWCRLSSGSSHPSRSSKVIPKIAFLFLVNQLTSCLLALLQCQ